MLICHIIWCEKVKRLFGKKIFFYAYVTLLKCTKITNYAIKITLFKMLMLHYSFLALASTFLFFNVYPYPRVRTFEKKTAKLGLPAKFSRTFRLKSYVEKWQVESCVRNKSTSFLIFSNFFCCALLFSVRSLDTQFFLNILTFLRKYFGKFSSRLSKISFHEIPTLSILNIIRKAGTRYLRK